MEQFLLLGFLGINSWMDIRKRQVSLWSVGIFSLAGVFCQWFSGKNLSPALLGLLPGAALILVSKATREALGMGDALLMLVLGIYLGFQETVNVLLLALLLSSVWAGVLLFVGKKQGSYTFPFVPFLFLGYVGVCLLMK